MKELNKKAFGGLLRLFATIAALLFLPAWTLDYWPAWIFLLAFFAPVLGITLYLMKNDPALLERRVDAGPGAEKERVQRIIQTLAAIAFVVVIVFPAFDRRFGWSTVPAWAAAAGDFLVALGLVFVFVVFKENTYASGAIEVGADQKVISTGPYKLVRHPMYAGAIVMLLGVPVVLGSWWGLLAVVPITLVIVWRLIDEERFLAQNLPGYSEYRNKVKYRLVPLVW
ncbi:MAG: isoprenylcysteine carboxylmethyltransferase family protein [Candidatus Acidiferrales bacterium]